MEKSVFVVYKKTKKYEENCRIRQMVHKTASGCGKILTEADWKKRKRIAIPRNPLF